ncbi:MAG: hypothetical protein ABFD89_16635 [Bryobacteraceae bacterium]
MDSLKNKEGVTIREMKDWLAQLPDQDENGEPGLMWVVTGPDSVSIVQEVKTVCRLGNPCDIELISSTTENSDQAERIRELEDMLVDAKSLRQLGRDENEYRGEKGYECERREARNAADEIEKRIDDCLTRRRRSRG